MPLTIGLAYFFNGMDGSCSEIWLIKFLDCCHEHDEEGCGINKSSEQELHWNGNNIDSLSLLSCLTRSSISTGKPGNLYHSISRPYTAYRYRIHLVQIFQEGYSRPQFSLPFFNN